jgi:Zn-dependent protease
MEQDPSRSRLVRFLTWSFPVGRTFGIQVRLFWTAGITFAYSLAQFWGVVPLATALGLAAIVFALLYLVVWTHEMGHALAARRWNVRTSQISLSVFGGLAHLQDGLPHPKAETVVSFAGPAVHLLWLGVLWPLGNLLGASYFLWTGDSWSIDPLRFAVSFATTINVTLAIFNLLPVFPMDGGRVLRSLLARRMHPNLATLWAARVGIVGSVGIAAWGLAVHGLWGGILLLIAVNNVLACLREMTAARHGDGPYGEPRDPWEGDPDAWKTGGGATEDPPARKRGGLRLLRRAAGTKPPDVLLQTGGDDDADLDRLLEKVGRVGLSGLTDVERATLQRISEARRRPR